MMKNSYKMLFILSMMIGSMISISSSSWFSLWMGLEINLLSFIPLMMSTKNLFSSESSLKYFLTQALASAVFFFSIILIFLFLNFKMNLIFYNFMIISSTMMMKSGTAPFHFWLPSVMEGLNWNSIFMLMTWQKIAPLMILSYSLSLNLTIFIIFFSMIFGSLGGMNQTSLRKLMAFSSINHLGWMMAGMVNNETLWMTYFMFYTFLNFCIIFLFNNFKLFNINQTFKLFYSNKFMNVSMFIMILSLGGLPPFIGFLPKWMIIELMITNNMYFILLFMLFMTLITLYFYLRITYAAFLLNHMNMNWNFKMDNWNKNMKIIMILNFFSVLGMLLINMFYFFI
uniref:NADH-ubiquinone oxidoreductase chain 2 n=1 Tax=Paratrichocladius tamaater TaxID=2050714 RepID=A0A8K1NJK3_9DIPT|nr:NADH dehydrogenase subunit 2 [Paratrichocladius tamaater]UDD74589.1 NADH dehydrogenase subunit 2 [Paratrichocladius tamaater]